MQYVFRAIAVAFLLLGAAPASALCSGAGIDLEYREADVVARVRVVAETRVTDDEPTPAHRARWGEYSPVMLHRLRVLQVFKGRPGPSINLFQEVTSGRFEIDVGSDYLIFLNYHRNSPALGSAARGAMRVRYACGQSKLWSAVTPRNLVRLRAISGQRQPFGRRSDDNRQRR